MTGVLKDPNVTIVLLGTFDSSAVLPSKLGEAGVIRIDEACAARFSALVPGQLVEYALDWCSVSVSRERFVVATPTPPFVKIADFVQKTLGDVMPHAAVTMMGINRNYGIYFSSPQERDAFGIRLVPPAAWGKWGEEIQRRILAESASGKHGGVVNVTIREIPVEGREIGWRDVTISAAQISGTDTPVGFIQLNDHFGTSDTNHPAGLEPQELAQRRTASLLRVLGDQFDQSLDALEAIAQDIVGS